MQDKNNFKNQIIKHISEFLFLQFCKALWDEETLNVQAEREDRNEFLQDLENQDEFYNGNAEELTEENKAYNLDVEAWSDFKRLIYHPRLYFKLFFKYQNGIYSKINSMIFIILM